MQGPVQCSVPTPWWQSCTHHNTLCTAWTLVYCWWRFPQIPFGLPAARWVLPTVLNWNCATWECCWIPWRWRMGPCCWRTKHCVQASCSPRWSVSVTPRNLPPFSVSPPPQTRTCVATLRGAAVCSRQRTSGPRPSWHTQHVRITYDGRFVPRPLWIL